MKIVDSLLLRAEQLVFAVEATIFFFFVHQLYSANGGTRTRLAMISSTTASTISLSMSTSTSTILGNQLTKSLRHGTVGHSY